MFTTLPREEEDSWEEARLYLAPPRGAELSWVPLSLCSSSAPGFTDPAKDTLRARQSQKLISHLVTMTPRASTAKPPNSPHPSGPRGH